MQYLTFCSGFILFNTMVPELICVDNRVSILLLFIFNFTCMSVLP